MEKCQSKKKNNAIDWVAKSIESIADKISIQNESPLPPETMKSKPEDEILGKMRVKMVSAMPVWGKISTEIKITTRHNKY